MARSHICLGRTYPTSALRQQLNIGKHIGRPHGAGLSAVIYLIFFMIAKHLKKHIRQMNKLSEGINLPTAQKEISLLSSIKNKNHVQTTYMIEEAKNGKVIRIF